MNGGHLIFKVKKKSYLESRREVVLEEPELDGSFGVLENRQHHDPEKEQKDWWQQSWENK